MKILDVNYFSDTGPSGDQGRVVQSPIKLTQG